MSREPREDPRPSSWSESIARTTLLVVGCVLLAASMLACYFPAQLVYVRLVVDAGVSIYDTAPGGNALWIAERDATITWIVVGVVLGLGGVSVLLVALRRRWT